MNFSTDLDKAKYCDSKCIREPSNYLRERAIREHSTVFKDDMNLKANSNSQEGGGY